MGCENDGLLRFQYQVESRRNQSGRNPSIPTVGVGEACSIMTGAPIPEGADAIVIIEESSYQDGFVTINGPARPDSFGEGEESKRSGGTEFRHPSYTSRNLSGCDNGVWSPMLQPGRKLLWWRVTRRSPGKPLDAGSIYESNTFAIVAGREDGRHSQRYDLIRDNIDSLRDALDEAESPATP